jgi:thymidylate kinase
MNGTAGLVAVEGINGKALKAKARAVLAAARGQRGGVSLWDASGLFEELTVAGQAAGLPSARALLLLYAADLAFRLRWEIRPALAEGHIVIAAPYVDTAIAFGRSAGLPRRWLRDLFVFAPPPTEWRYVDAAPARGRMRREGFVEFGRQWMDRGPDRRELMASVRRQLQAEAQLRARRIATRKTESVRHPRSA